MTETQAIQAAKDVLNAHLVALNAHDEAALAETLHFPHYRLSEGVLKTWEHPDEYFQDFRKRAGKNWGYTEWGEITPVQVGEDKVHVIVRVDRFRPDDSPLSSFPSLWVISKQNGTWAAQLRSSFAADSKNGLLS
jgi:hypothetical protein